MEPPQTNIPPTRSYQQEMLDASLIKNVVIVLDTGSGKTHIAVLRMKIECDREAKKISWFIAPTVGLCEQQRDVISSSLSVPVGLISGALQPDQWTDEKLWKQALSTHRIIVSTPQVLLDALRHGYVNLGHDIGLIVFDEAHHAADNHPYNMIMREFYDQCSPRTASDSGSMGVRPNILGLTASPVFGGNISTAFQKIEQNLDSVILAPRQTRDELAKYVHKPIFKRIVYQPNNHADEWKRAMNVVALSEVVGSLDIDVDPTVILLRRQLTNTIDPTKVKRIDQRLSEAIVKKDTFVNKGMRDFLRTAKELCSDIGTWAADWYVYNVINKALKANADALHLLFAERHHNEKTFLIKVLRSVKVTNVSYDTTTIVRGCSPKANDFIGFLLYEKREWEGIKKEVFSGIVFITRRDSALALSELLRHHPCTAGFFSIGTLLGSSESIKRNSFLDITRSLLFETQSEVLNAFRIGEKNLVISTAVAEEGIDIQTCCSVFRWDLPQNMVSLAQSRGRARRERSSFVLMFEDGGCHAELIKKWEALEQQMIRKYNEDRTRLTEIAPSEGEWDEEDDEYREFVIESTGAKVTLHSAISHVAHFCSTLRSAVRSEDQPAYDINPPDYPQGYHALVNSGLTGGPLPKYPGPYGATLTLPRLLPPGQRVYSTEEKHKTKQAARRHVALDAYVALYKAGLLNDNLLPLSSSIAPLQEEEVQNLLKDIEKRDGMATVRQQLDPWTMIPLGDGEGDKWYLNKLELEGVGEFRMFTRLELPRLNFSSDVLYDPEFGIRTFSICPIGPASLTGYEITAAKHYTRILFSIFYGNRINWEDLNYAYLFLPPSDAEGSVDVWEERRGWAESVRPKDRRLSARDRVTVQASLFAYQYRNPSDVFFVVHGGSTYRFKRWRDEILKPEEETAIRKKYSWVKDLDISYPLIEAKPLQSRTNFLLPSQNAKTQKRDAMLPPQLSQVVLESKKNVLLSLFLPSILRATFIKLIVSSFQGSLLKHSPALRRVPLDLIQTAIMAPAANANSNFERLEALGDTVLKFITSVQLLAEHPTWPEAFLAKRKDHAVSNVHLAKSAIGKRLYRWIIRSPFLSRKKWTPDYMSSQTDGDSSDISGGVRSDSNTTHEQASEDVIEEDEESLGDPGDESDNILVELSTKTLADVVESLIGASYLTGGFDSSIVCVQSFSIDIGGPWKPLSERICSILESVASLNSPPSQLVYPEAILGYNFSHKMLLIEALMHASSQSDIESMSYERMEFLGDALLDMIVIEELYRAEAKGKIFTPGDMHIRKSALVNMHFLGFVCLRAHVVLDSSLPRWDATLKQALPATAQHTTRLSTCILHSSGAILDEQRDAFARFERGQAEIEVELETGRTFPWAALARLQAPKFLSDIVESTIGAVYLDSNGNMDAVKGVLEKLGVMKVLRRLVDEDIEVLHPVSRVAEWATKNQKIDGLEYKMDRKSGNVTCILIIDGEEITSVKERYNGKASEEDVRFRVAEEGMKILLGT